MGVIFANMKRVSLIVLLVCVCIAQDFYQYHEPTVYSGDVRIERDGDSLRLSFQPELLDDLGDVPLEEDFFFQDDSFYVTVNIGWNPEGHPPPGVWTYPHFDFHFYVVDQATRATAQCSSFPPCPQDETSAALYHPIDEDYIPEDYEVDINSAIPNMGIHVEWQLDPQIANSPPPVWRTATWIYGFISGEIAFLEPMVTRELIESKQTFVRSINQPKVYPKTGDYPLEYRVYWDDDHERHVIELGDLRRRQKGERCCQQSSDSSSGSFFNDDDLDDDGIFSSNTSDDDSAAN